MKNKDLNLKLNAIGRFSMSNWSNKNISVGNKSENSKLANWIEIKNFGIKNTTKYLKKNFNINVRKKLSLLDVGCADGYLTENLASLGFKKCVGVEPRISSIKRGKNIRKILKIKERCKYYSKSINQIDDKFKYDIVTCFGVLHHTNNIYKNLKKILSLSKKILILEGEFIPENLYQNKDFQIQGQLKDLIYSEKLKKLKYGITLHKYETSYYDGSTDKTGIVDIPSIDSIRMHADIMGYNSKVIAKNKFKNKLKTYRAIIIFNKKKIELFNDKKVYAKYEQDFIKCFLPIKLLKSFLKKKLNQSFEIQHGSKYKNITDKFKFNFLDKLNLEFAKYYLFKDVNFKMAKKYLEKIIYKKNADWFSCYRAFYLLFLFDIKKKFFWKQMLLSCHPNFPLILLKKKLSNFQI